MAKNRFYRVWLRVTGQIPKEIAVTKGNKVRTCIEANSEERAIKYASKFFENRGLLNLIFDSCEIAR